MRRFLIQIGYLICFACSTQSINAQYMVMHAGGGISSQYGGDTKHIGTFRIGAGWEFELSQRLSLEPQLLYVSQGWKLKDESIPNKDNEGNIIVDDNGNIVYTKKGTSVKANYLVLPILANYYLPLGNPHYLYFNAGPYVAYGVGGNTRISGDPDLTGAERHYYDISTFQQKDIHRFDAGVILGLGYEFNRTIKAGIDCHWGLTDVTTSGRKNISVCLSIGYRIFNAE